MMIETSNIYKKQSTWKLLFIYLLFIPFLSCNEERYGEDNTKDVAVTGSVIKQGATYAELDGFINLNRLPSGHDPDSYGILFETDEKGIEHKLLQKYSNQGEILADELLGRELKVNLINLRPNTTYKFRTFLDDEDTHYYGEVRTFTTDDYDNLISNPKVDSNNTFATITATLDYDQYNELKGTNTPFIGFFMSEKKEVLENPLAENSYISYDYYQFDIQEKPIRDTESDDEEDDEDSEPATILLKKTLENLKESQTYYYRTVCIFNGVPKMSNIISFKTADQYLWKNVTSQPMAQPSYFTALLGAKVDMDSFDDKRMSLGFAWSKDKKELVNGGNFNDVQYRWEVDAENNRYIAADINGLEDNTTYYFCAYTKANDQYKFSNIASFMTLDADKLPNVVSDPYIVAVTYTSATLKANVDKENYDKDLMTIGFAYSTNKEDIQQDGEFEHIDCSLPESNDNSYITININNLKDNTTYYYCTYTKVGGKYKFGTILSYTVTVPNVVYNPSVTDVKYTTATLNAHVDYAKYDKNLMTLGFAWSKNKNDLVQGGKFNYSDKTPYYNSGNYNISANISALEVNTTYYYCTYTKVNGQYKFGSINSFTTLDYSNVVYNPSATNISYTTATLNAQVEYDKYDKNSMTLGFAWSKNKNDLVQGGSFQSINKTPNSQNGDYYITADISGLENNTTYFYCAYTKMGDKYMFSEIKSFKTLDYILSLIDMVTVEGGTFTIGATSEQGSDYYSNELPSHRVTLSTFQIGKTEVTQELWVAVMGSNPSYFNGKKLPVEKVSWDDCQTFISKLNNITGKKFRLPTEAEWEYAARGGNKSKGYKYAGSNSIGSVAWYSSNSISQTHEVGTKSTNELGIYDMSGNVWEWCQDYYGSYSSAAQTNPKGPASGSNRVLRGGSWDYAARSCRVSRRYGGAPGRRDYDRGFRLAL